MAGQLEQATVGVHEPVVHPPGADRDACGRVSPVAARGEAGQRRVEQGFDIPVQARLHRTIGEAVDLADLQAAPLEPAGGHAAARRAEVDSEVPAHAHTAV